MQDLIERIKECNSCSEELEWLNNQTSKEDILNNFPQE
jgi:hypothetical protein